METIIVGMSGGVDSSVAALLLKEQGHNVIGVTMRLFDERLPRLGGEREIEDARRVCEVLGIEHHVADLSDEFRRAVVDEFVSEYRRGRTPNPCITCNRALKFGALLEWARAHGGDAIATGHYVDRRFNPESGRFELHHTGSAKDQSYVLWQLSQEQLSRARFPLVGMEKDEIRALAKRAALPVAQKKDSMEICFIEDDNHVRFIEEYTGKADKHGAFVSTDGTLLGTHQGITHYTIGQRKGLGVAFGQPMYVVALDAEKNTVTLGKEGTQLTDALTADRLNFVSISTPDTPIRVEAKIRYQAKPAPAWLSVKDEVASVTFDTPQRSVTPGQSVVFYKGGLLLGGGLIH